MKANAEKLLFILSMTALLTLFSSCAKNTELVESPRTEPKLATIATPSSPVQNDGDIISARIEAIYQDFFEADSKCRKNYDEIFGKDDGFYTKDSPCSASLIFNANGNAVKTIELKRYGKVNKKRQTVEKAAWTARITPAQFKALTNFITGNEFFKSSAAGPDINVSNCSLALTESNGQVKTLLGNVENPSNAFVPLAAAFKKLESEIKWEKAS